MNSLHALRSRQTTVLQLEIGESVRVGEHLVTLREVNGLEAKVFVERISGDDVEDDFSFEDLSGLLTANYESV